MTGGLCCLAGGTWASAPGGGCVSLGGTRTMFTYRLLGGSGWTSSVLVTRVGVRGRSPILNPDGGSFRGCDRVPQVRAAPTLWPMRLTRPCESLCRDRYAHGMLAKNLLVSGVGCGCGSCIAHGAGAGLGAGRERRGEQRE